MDKEEKSDIEEKIIKNFVSPDLYSKKNDLLWHAYGTIYWKLRLGLIGELSLKQKIFGLKKEKYLFENLEEVDKVIASYLGIPLNFATKIRKYFQGKKPVLSSESDDCFISPAGRATSELEEIENGEKKKKWSLSFWVRSSYLL